jgi:hypothetical protein
MSSGLCAVTNGNKFTPQLRNSEDKRHAAILAVMDEQKPKAH